MVALARWEMVGRGLVDGEQRRSAYGIDGEDAPAVEGGRGVAGELRESEVELKVGSARAERPWSIGATVSSSSPAFRRAVAAFWGFGAGNWRESEGIGMWVFSWC